MAVSFFSPTNSSYLCNLIPSCNTTLNLVDYVFKTFLESQQVDETSQSTPLASERSSFVHNCSLAIYVIFGAVVAYYYYKPVTLEDVRSNVHCLKSARHAQRDDADFMSAAVKINPNAALYASSRLRGDYAFMTQLVPYQNGDDSIFMELRCVRGDYNLIGFYAVPALMCKISYFNILQLVVEANKGAVDAQNKLGMLYKDGVTVKQSDEIAIMYFKMAADQGFAEALNNLGVYCESKQDYIGAFDYYKRGTENGSGNAWSNLGTLYYDGNGVEQSTAEAITHFKRAAEMGIATAFHNIGICYYEGRSISQDLDKAYAHFSCAAEKGHVDAQNCLGICYKDGLGVNQSDEEAAKWFLCAAKKGHVDAQNSLGICYNGGLGVNQSDEEAAKWFLRAAKKGHVDAQNSLGICYKDGLGVNQSDEEAAKWFLCAAKKGHVDAQNSLGICYNGGLGVNQSDEEAAKWFLCAAKKGHVDAQNSLGICYKDGLGVNQSDEEAAKWFLRANLFQPGQGA